MVPIISSPSTKIIMCYHGGILYFHFISFLVDIISKNQDIFSHFSRLQTRATNSPSLGVVDLMCPTGNKVVMKFPTIGNLAKGVVMPM